MIEFGNIDYFFVHDMQQSVYYGGDYYKFKI